MSTFPGRFDIGKEPEDTWCQITWVSEEAEDTLSFNKPAFLLDGARQQPSLYCLITPTDTHERGFTELPRKVVGRMGRRY